MRRKKWNDDDLFIYSTILLTLKVKVAENMHILAGHKRDGGARQESDGGWRLRITKKKRL